MVEFSNVVTVAFVVWVIVERVYVVLSKVLSEDKNATEFEKKSDKNNYIKIAFLSVGSALIGWGLWAVSDVRILASLNVALKNGNWWVDGLLTVVFFALGPNAWRTIIKFVEGSTG